MLLRNCIALLIGLTAAIPAWAQPSPSLNAAEIKLKLRKLDTLGSVLYVAAHPDDENTRLLGYLAQEKCYRTGYLSLTRGDGGQNLVGDEQGELLGLIRTQELLAARRIDGAEQFFTRARDFGFSKNPAETFTIWDRKKILGDVVWVIRKFQPDIIICRFPADSRAGHGHHTASAILAAEAFDAAADPKQYPEQLQYLKPWQAKRLLWNTYSFGSINTTADDQFKINVGVFNHLLGKGYGEIAAESRSQHKSQGFGVPAARGTALEYFTPIKGPAPKNNLLDGVSTSWDRIPNAGNIPALVDNATAAYNMDNPASAVPALLELRKALQQLPQSYWRDIKLKETEQLVIACTGLWVEAYSQQPTLTPGQNAPASVQLIVNSNINVQLSSLHIPGKDTALNNTSLQPGQLITFPQQLNVPNTTVFTQPYWLRQDHTAGEYGIPDPMLVGYPENIPPLEASIDLTIAGQPFNIHRPFQYKYTDPVKGELYESLVIAPPVVATLATPVWIFTDTKAQVVPIKLKAMTTGAKGAVTLRLPHGFSAQEQTQPFELSGKGDEKEIRFHVAPAKINGANKTDSFTVVINVNGKEYTQSILQINYDHIPSITLFPTAQGKLVTVSLQHNGNKLGYIAGAGDKVAAALQQVGYQVSLLGEKEIMDGSLQQYDAIITGVRAYNTNPRLKYWQPRLLEYVKNGGTLLVQYNTNSPLVTTELGPYPFALSRDRVTDENASVQILDAAKDIMQYPNKLSQQDFDGWVQERGLYFPENIDNRYGKLFSMQDKDEPLRDGSTIIARYGKGRYVYTGLSFFRQLPAGVPGAYRLFINLLSDKK
ncbi:PIG-L family deacetylase [Chitinophaga pendula]|uniref:PIG-L family deacetylase n=1 Tax=Chitinophaga TaxID=79328 RepID=UPI000BAEF6A0|nr:MULTISPECIES: PIG-L family deacetylase [Chitinophaga]ASZ12806.1 LmbE family protein [Chitinophaga sp. MD30]UCJ09570.1 PIG-L family deacetylase [Chitinophaga pendula]